MAWLAKEGEYWWLLEKAKDPVTGRWKNRSWTTGQTDHAEAEKVLARYTESKMGMEAEVAAAPQGWKVEVERRLGVLESLVLRSSGVHQDTHQEGAKTGKNVENGQNGQRAKMAAHRRKTGS